MARRTISLLAVLALVAWALPVAADPSGYLQPEGDQKTLDKAAKIFRQGVSYLDKGSPSLALRSFHRAAGLCPGFFEARYNIAKLEGEKGGHDKAVAGLETLCRDFPGAVRPFNDLGQLLVDHDVKAAARAFDTAVTNGEKLLKDRAIQAAGQDTLTQVAVDLAFAYHNRGALRLGEDKLESARTDFLRSVELNDANFFSHYGLGLVLLQQGEYTAAKEAFKRAKKLKRSFADCSIGLARAYLGMTPPKPAFAIVELKEAAQLTDASAQVEELLGNAYRLKGDFPAALEHYEKALALGAGRDSIALKRALVARDRGDHEGARKHLRECMAKAKEPRLLTRALRHMGELAELDKDYETAIEHFTKALELDPESTGARLHLGACLFHTGNYEEAEKHLAASLAQYGDKPPPAMAQDVALARKLLDKIRNFIQNDTKTN